MFNANEKDRRQNMSTYIQSSPLESPNPIGNLVRYIPNITGVHDSDVMSQQGFCESGVRGSDICLLRDCRSHEKLLMDQMDLRIPPSGTRFHSDHDECQNTIVGFPLAYEDTQGSKSYLHGIGNVISDSKYLKPTQKLLYEVVNVKKTLKQHSKHDFMFNSKEFYVSKNERDSIPVSAAEKRDLQNKMAKLSSMLNEVDRRYKQYYHQMQTVISSFDSIAGCGATAPYTSLTLETISCKFRILKDTINSQIKVISTRLGETDSNGEGIGIPKLRFVDQQRRVQQFGCMHRHIWRPNRGLPESSVSILRAWLFEHFLHPYPKDSDKKMLARQTGLSRSQVVNWFINARVRLWKPMVEEMYKSESANTVMDSNSSSEP